MTRLILWIVFGILSTLDTLFPGWSQPVQVEPDHGDPLSTESLNYWLTDERHRRARE